MPPSVSVVIATYNHARFLPVSIGSALDQTSAPHEVIVVDDGSTDRTSDVVAEHVAADPRVRYVRQPNHGRSAARNTGIASASGELIAFLDADDVWEPEKLARQLPHFADRTVGVVYSALSVIDPNGGAVSIEKPRGHWRPRSGRITRRLLYANFIPLSSAVVRRSLLEPAGTLFDERLEMAEDWDLWLRLSLQCAFVVVRQPLVRYRVGHPDQSTQHEAERIAWAEFVLSRFLETHPAVVGRSARRRIDAFRCVSRARESQARRALFRSTMLYLRALRHRWACGPAYRGLLKNLLLVASRHA